MTDWAKVALPDTPFLDEESCEVNGIRFYCLGSDMSRELEVAYREAIAKDDEEIHQLAKSVAGQLKPQADWRVEPLGGAGDDSLWIMGFKIVGALYCLLRTPKAAVDAWRTIQPLLKRMKTTARIGWTVSMEGVVLECYELIAKKYGTSWKTAPELVHIIRDGRRFSGAPGIRVGIHLVMIPELVNKKTFIFLIDNTLKLYDQVELDYLTHDAEQVLQEDAHEVGDGGDC